MHDFLEVLAHGAVGPVFRLFSLISLKFSLHVGCKKRLFCIYGGRVLDRFLSRYLAFVGHRLTTNRKLISAYYDGDDDFYDEFSAFSDLNYYSNFCLQSTPHTHPNHYPNF